MRRIEWIAVIVIVVLIGLSLDFNVVMTGAFSQSIVTDKILVSGNRTLGNSTNETNHLVDTNTTNGTNDSPATNLSVPSVSSNSSSTTSSSSLRSIVEESVKEATRLLYEKSPHLDFWLRQPLPKVFIYDTISPEWSDTKIISACVDQHFLGQNGSGFEHNVSAWPNCHWYPKVCSDVQVAEGELQAKYMGYRYNYNGDILNIEWFRGYPVQTKDPLEADLFVVPYPYKSQCLCHRILSRKRPGCTDRWGVVNASVVSKLEHWGRDAELDRKHLWFLSTDSNGVGPQFWKQLYLTTSLGDVRFCQWYIEKELGAQNKTEDNLNKTLTALKSYTSPIEPIGPCGHFVQSNTNTDASLQPGDLYDQEWWTSERDLSVGAVYGSARNLKMRVQFLNDWKRDFGGEALAGKPAMIEGLSRDRKPKTNNETNGIYQRSLFCPILPGDTANQKRFFDVMLNGCVPLVPVWPSFLQGQRSTFGPGGTSTGLTYPFHRGVYYEDPMAGIDYLNDLVVTFDGECGIPCIKGAVEKALSNQTEFDRKRENIRRFARFFTNGLEEQKYRFADSHAATLVTIRHYLYGLAGKLPTQL